MRVTCDGVHGPAFTSRVTSVAMARVIPWVWATMLHTAFVWDSSGPALGTPAAAWASVNRTLCRSTLMS
eukprot:9489403-Pyramimonas_sp.AAC.1